jgi:hypothetical protein
MADEHVDPSANTDQFRAFVQSSPAEPARSKAPLMIGVAVAVLAVAVIAILLLR